MTCATCWPGTQLGRRRTRPAPAAYEEPVSSMSDSAGVRSNITRESSARAIGGERWIQPRSTSWRSSGGGGVGQPQLVPGRVGGLLVTGVAVGLRSSRAPSDAGARWSAAPPSCGSGLRPRPAAPRSRVGAAVAAADVGERPACPPVSGTPARAGPVAGPRRLPAAGQPRSAAAIVAASGHDRRIRAFMALREKVAERPTAPARVAIRSRGQGRPPGSTAARSAPPAADRNGTQTAPLARRSGSAPSKP